MKTTIDIPKDVLEQSMKFTGAKTKRDAVVAAMETYNRRAKAEAFIKRLKENPPLDFLTNDEIEAAEVETGNRAFGYHQSSPPKKQE